MIKNYFTWQVETKREFSIYYFTVFLLLVLFNLFPPPPEVNATANLLWVIAFHDIVFYIKHIRKRK